MSILIGFLYVVEVVACLLLVLVVMLQKPKEGGLGGAIGGGMLEASLGADAGNVLIKTTAVLGSVFLLNTLVLARLTSTVHSHSLMATENAPAKTEQAAPELPSLDDGSGLQPRYLRHQRRQRTPLGPHRPLREISISQWSEPFQRFRRFRCQMRVTPSL